MKKNIIYLTVVLLLLSLSNGWAQTPQENWTRANELYASGNYAEAGQLYQEIETVGSNSADLYYNLGNVFFKQRMWGKSILYYERALKLHPEDKDISYNLAMANVMITDKIETTPDFFISTWIRNIHSTAGADTWAWSSIAFFVVCLVFSGLFFFGRSIVVRKFSFFLALFALLGCGCCVLFGHYQQQDLNDHSKAIIMQAVTTIKSSPDNSGKDLFILHEGTKVNLLESLGQWQRIQLADGRQGWLMSGTIEKI